MKKEKPQPRVIRTRGPIDLGHLVSITGEYEEDPDADGGRVLHVRVTFEADVGVVMPGKCSVCEAETPDGFNHEGLLDIYLHRDGERLLFPRGEDMESERDSYPVTGWRGYGDELMCSICWAAIDDAVSLARAKRRAKGTP